MAAKRPAALKSIADAIGFNPAADPEGYKRLLGDRYDQRTAADRATEDVGLRNRIFGGGDPVDSFNAANSMAGNAVARSQSDQGSGPTGYARQFVPFFEAQHLQADINPGMTFKTDFGGLSDLPASPKPGLPPGYTDDRYKRELDTYAGGGAAPGFTDSDSSGFPEVGKRFQSEMSARLAPSLRSLKRQGGL